MVRICGAFVTLQCSPCFLVADCDVLNFPLSGSMTYKSGKGIGLWWIWSARAVTFGPCRCHFGSRPLLIAGYLRRRLQQAESFGPLVVTERHGVTGSQRTLFGTSFDVVRNGCGWIMLRHMTC